MLKCVVEGARGAFATGTSDCACVCDGVPCVCKDELGVMGEGATCALDTTGCWFAGRTGGGTGACETLGPTVNSSVGV